MSASIVLDHVSLTSSGQRVLDNVSVEVPTARSTVVVGPSGSGKSSLLKVAAGLLQPQHGRVTVGGNDLWRISEARRHQMRDSIGFVFQDGALWANKSIEENLTLPVLVHRRDLSRPQIRALVHGRLAGFGLERVARLRPHDLSAGEQKVVSLLRALVLDPHIVLMDEPLLSVDHHLAERVKAEVRALQERGCTLMMVTHDTDLTSHIAEHLVVVKAGTVIASGPFEVIKASTDPAVRTILEGVLGEIVSYDSDLLHLLAGQGEEPGDG